MQAILSQRRAAVSLSITPDLHPGFRLRRLRGHGSFGQVWEAETDAGEPVALKFMPYAGGQAVMEVRSLQLIREVSHPGLVRMGKLWSTSGCLVVAMELADGSLTDLLDIYQADLGTGLPRDHLLSLLAPAAEALDFLNNCQHYLNGQWVTIQHCDVTPSNLLVFDKVVKVSDFGLTTTLTGREKSHHRAGTPAFAGPEIFQGRVSERTDQYALAVSYCVLRGGRSPFPDTPANIEPGYFRPLPDLSMLDPEERPAILRALASAPPDRWPSCGELLGQLARATRSQELPSKPPERRRAARYRPDAAVACHVLPTLGNQPWRAEVQNVSAGGLRLRVYQPGSPLRAGRVLELALLKPAEGLCVSVRFRLTHSAELEGGDYEVGGTFDRPLEPGQVEALAAGGP